MSSHSTLSPKAAADRLAIRELFDAYAHCADTRDVTGQKALFTADTRFSVFMDGPRTDPTSVLEGRDSLAPVFNDLNRYEHTMHFNGQSTVVLDGNDATGDSYTIAHHLYTEDDTRMMMVAWLHYLDRFTKIGQDWYIADRQIILVWSETRPLGAPTAG
jgi:SnoaL-like domain